MNKRSVEKTNAISSENQRKHTNALCVENLGSFYLKPCDT